MGFLSSSVERISKYKPGRTVGYFINYKSNLTELQRQVEDLKRLRYRQQHNGEATIHDEEVLRLIQYGQKLLERPRAWSLHRCRFSREVRETMEEISRLLSLKVENPSYGPGFDLRMSTFWEVMQSLKDDNVRLIGVHGMSGVGKTTLVKEVSRYAVEEGLFDAIVWSVVTPAPDVIRIQDEIAEILGLRLHLTQSQSERADKIYKWLTNNRERKFLIILDDVWDHRDLEGIGIPMAGDCVPFKVLLTSRNIEILRNVNSGMNVIHVTILPKEEAFLLFNQIVGNTASIYSDTVLEIVETCEGLPMAIEVVAEKLKHEPLSEWKSTITEFISHMLSRIKLSYDYLRNEEEKFIFLLCSILGEQIYCEDLLKYGLGLGLFWGTDTFGAARNKVYHMTNSLKGTCLLQDGKTSQYATMHRIYREFAIAIASSDPDWFIVRKDGWPIEWPDDEMAKVSYVSLIISNYVHELPEALLFPNLKLLHVYDENCSLEIPDNFFKGTKDGLRVLALIKMQLLSLPSSLLVQTNIYTLCLDYCMLRDISIIGELRSLRVLSLSHTNIAQLPIQIGQLTCLRLLDLSNCSNLDVIPSNVLSSLIQLEELRMGNSFTNWMVEGLDYARSNASLAELTHLDSLTALDIHIPNAEMILEPLPWDNLDRYNIIIGQDFPCSRDHEAFKVLKLNCDKGKIEGSKHWIESLLKSCEELWLKEFKDFENVLSELNGDAFLELKHLRIQDNAELEHLPSKVVFDTLETLVLKNLLNFRVIQSCDSEFLCSFKNLTIVKIECCPLLESIFNLSAHNGPFQLRELEISQCTKMVAIANNSRDDVKFVDGQLFFDGVPSAFGFPCLQTLTLQDLDNLIGFFKCAAGGREIISAEANMYSGSLFLNLAAALPHSKHLKLINIPKIRHLVASTAADWVVPLQDLETMEIVECNDLCHLFVTEGRFDENYGGLLPELRQLCLRNLGNFRSILSNDHPRRILNFKMLNQLTVHNCNQLRYLLPHYVLNNLMQVRSIDISDCAMLEQIFGYEEDIIMGESKNNEMLPLLHSLKLSNLPKLASICSGVRHPINLRLKQMAIEDCPNLAFTFAHSRTQADEKESSMESEGKNLQIIIVPSLLENVNLRQLNHLKTMWKDHLLSFMHLRSLQLHGCDNLVYLFSLSVARGLSCLQELKIISSTRVEQIVRGEMGVTASAYTVEFPRVNTLILEDLPNMTQFCDHEFTVKWLSLKVIRVVGCPNIRKFSLGMVDIHQFTSVDVVFNFSNQREIDDLIAISHLFKLTDKLSSLEELIIEGLEELKNIMEAQLKPSFFTNLKMLEVRQCDNKLNVFLSILLPRSCRLECLTVENCKLLELVFDLKHLVADGEGNGLFPNLKTMRLLDLPKLNYIWNMDPSGIMDLRKLVKLEIINCGLLRNLASIGVVETLVQLKILAVHSCKMIEEVITIKVGEKTDKEGRCFPNLRDLVIANLPNFRRFNSGNCKFRFPNLLSLRIKHCPKINAFTTGFLSAQGPTINSRTTEHAFDEMMDVYPNLKILELLGLDSLKVIWQGFDSTKSFSELEELEVDTLCNLEYIFPSSMLPRLKKLKTLFVRNCSSLRNVFLLTEKQDIKLSMAFQNLKIVQVQSCDSLRHMLLPSNCLNLEALEISECKNLEEIFIDTEEEKRDAKVLPHLKSIILENLPKLSNFSLETFKFPSLVKVKIVECPALKAFKPGSTRNVSAPVNNFFSDMDNFEKLKELHLTNVAGCQNIWNNDLSSGSLCELQIINLCKSTVLNIVSSNMLTRLLKLEKITVQSNELEVVFDINENSLPDIGEMELLPQLYELVLIDLPYMELWKQEPKIPVFRNLTSLEIIRCKSIKKLFSTSVGKNLDALKLLKLYECINMVQVLQGGGERGQILFNNLECLILKYLPCLTSFCEQEVAFEFPKLQMVKVEGIPNMETFVKGFLTTPKLKEVYTTDIRKCWQGELNATIKWLYQNQDFRDDDYIRDGIGTSNQPAFNATDNSAQFPVESHALAIALDGGGNVVPLLSPAPLPEGDGEVAMFDVEEGGCEVCEGGQQSGEATHKHGDQDDDDNVHVVPRHLVERQDQEASLLTGMPTSQDAVKSNVVEILPLSSPAAPQETEPPSPGTTCALKVPEVREIVELMKLEGVESLMLGEAFKTYPQLCLSREDRSDHLLSFSYRVLLDILNILDSRTPLTITESDKKSLEKNLKDALVLGFDKDWLESTRGKVFDCDLSEVNQAREVLEWLEGELESNEAALAAVCDEETEAIRAVEAAQEEIVTQLCFDTCQQEVGTKLLDARRDMVAKRDQCLQIIAAKDRHFGI